MGKIIYSYLAIELICENEDKREKSLKFRILTMLDKMALSSKVPD
jgi:hypothetical protein